MEISLKKESGIKLPKRSLIRTARTALQKANCEDAVINISLVSDSTIKKLNKAFRGKNKPTDVLSFNIPNDFPGYTKRTCIGDVIISVETAAKNAKEDGKSIDAELMELVVHGVLHVCGYDHSNKMFKLQALTMKEVLSPNGRLKRT